MICYLFLCRTLYYLPC